MSEKKIMEGMDSHPSKPPHHMPRLVLLGATWVVLAINMMFTSLAQIDATTFKTGLFLNTTGDAMDYALEIRPASWAFAIWGPIYIFQVVWLAYATSTVFRRCGDSYLFYNPNYLHPSLYFIYMANLMCSTAWTFLWDRLHTLPALIFLCLMSFTLYLLLIISIHGLYKYQADLEAGGRPREYKLVIGMVHNAFGIYAAWCTIATLLNFCNVVSYTYPLISQEISSSVSLSILVFEIMIYMLVDLGWLERYTRFLWTPYVVLVWALAAVLQRNFDATKPNSVITLALVVAVLFFAVLKLILVIYREKRDPSFGVPSGRVSPFKEKDKSMMA